jgi:hypothetical protein
MGGPPGFGPPGGFGGPAAPPAEEGSNKTLIGCGIAGCLGLLLIVGALVAFFVFVPKSGGDGPSSSGGGPTQPNNPTGGNDPSRSPPTSGGLRDRMPQRVGRWTAQGVKPVSVSGALEGIQVEYTSSGASLSVLALAFSSSNEAHQAMLALAEGVGERARVTPKNIRIRDPKTNEVIGEGRHFVASPEAFSYQTGKLATLIVGPQGDVIPFWNEFPL